MSNDGDSYVKVEIIPIFATLDAVKAKTDGEEFWIPRSVLFGPEESDIEIGHLDQVEKTLRIRQWFAKKQGLI